MKTVEDIIMELLANRYIKICEENNMQFKNFKSSCKEEATKQILEDKKRKLKTIYKKQSKLSKNVKIWKPVLNFKD